MRKNNKATFSFAGYLLFLFPLSITVGFPVIIYQSMVNHGFNTIIIALMIFVYIMFATFLFCLIDILRRRLMVDSPTNQILTATERIATGDFSVKLHPLHAYYKYDDYDRIMENLNKMTEELSKSEILKSEFISNVSHEIKTPLFVIQNYAKALKNPKLDNETKEKYIDTLIITSKKLSDLVTNILKMNKLENQALSLEKSTINAGEMLREIVLSFEPLFEKKNINLSCDIDDSSLLINDGHIQIIFNNLISNAIKFTKDNGSIFISLKDAPSQVEFLVKDTGIGINKETGKHIFEKFYQGDTSHSSEGNGLGLALVKKVIDLNGGEIKVESEENKGSTFTVTLKKE